MWKVLKFFGRLIKAMLWLVLLLVIAGIACLYIAGRGLPDALVQKIADRLSSDPRIQGPLAESSSLGPLVFRIDRITYSIRHGLTIHRIRALPVRVTEHAFISAEEINVAFTLLSLAPLRDRLQRVTFKGLDLPALPPKPPRDPDEPQPPHVPREINIRLPEVSPFELVLENANILGLQPERITATIALTAAKASATHLRANWPKQAGDVIVLGECAFDPETKRIAGTAQGRAFPHLITPFLLGLRAKGAVTQIDAFQDFTSPASVHYSVDLELTTMDYAMFIDIEARDCTCRGVPVNHLMGKVVVTDTNNLTIADIDLHKGELRSGTLTGHLIYRDDDDSVFIDVRGTAPKPDILSIINVLNHGELDLLQCETPVSAVVKGIVATNLKKAGATNDLNATLSFAKGSILSVPLTEVSCDLKVVAHSACVDNIKAKPADGGTVEGFVHFAFPDYEASNTTFVAKISAVDADFSNLMCIAQTNNTFAGKATGSLTLAGSASGNILASLDGDGQVAVEDSVFTRIPLFAWLTDWLANNIPGISSVVNQSSLSLNFTVTNGVAVTENMLVEGNVFSILCKGNYTPETDVIDMVVRVNVFRERTWLGKVTHVLTFPFTRLLLEFRISGTASDPKWSYINIIERLTDAIF